MISFDVIRDGTSRAKEITNYHIFAGRGCAIFWGAFFEEKINFGVSFYVKSQVNFTYLVKILDPCDTFRVYFQWLANFSASFSRKFMNFRV